MADAIVLEMDDFSLAKLASDVRAAALSKASLSCFFVGEFLSNVAAKFFPMSL